MKERQRHGCLWFLIKHRFTSNLSFHAGQQVAEGKERGVGCLKQVSRGIGRGVLWVLEQPPPPEKYLLFSDAFAVSTPFVLDLDKD